MLKGSKHKPESLLKISKAKKGNTNLLGFKFSEESKKKMSESHKGKPSSSNTKFKKGHVPWCKGKKFTDEHRKNISIGHKGQKPSDKQIKMARQRWSGIGNPNYGKPMNPDLKLKLINIHKTRKRSLEEVKKRSDAQKGEKGSNWKGGITPKQKSVRNSVEYKTWRKAVFERDNYTCQNCGARGVIIHADHIKSFAHYPELRFELSNGRTLCIDCHEKTDNYKRKADNPLLTLPAVSTTIEVSK